MNEPEAVTRVAKAMRGAVHRMYPSLHMNADPEDQLSYK
jgi:hypothetical protein